MSDLPSTENALSVVTNTSSNERTPKHRPTAAWQGKHDLTPVSSSERRPPLKGIKSSRSGWEKGRRKEVLTEIVSGVIREGLDGCVSSEELEDAARNYISQNDMSSLNCLSEVTNQSLVGTVKKIVKTCTYNPKKKVYYGIALKVSDVSCLFTTPVHGVYGTQDLNSDISNLLQRFDII